MKAKRIYTPSRIVALVVIGVMLLGLTYLRVSSSPATVSVPQGAHAGQLTMHACTYATEQGAMPADCGTLVVPENRASSKSRLIALPVIRILARSSHPLAPIFHLNGGPGITNMTFPQADRLAADHDVVMLGYRGVKAQTLSAYRERFPEDPDMRDFDLVDRFETDHPDMFANLQTFWLRKNAS